MIYTSRDMKYIARHVSRQEILRKIISESQTLAAIAKELCDEPESREAMKALNSAASILSGMLEILDVKNGQSPDMAAMNRTDAFYINDWANSLREAEKNGKRNAQH